MLKNCGRRKLCRVRSYIYRKLSAIGIVAVSNLGRIFPNIWTEAPPSRAGCKYRKFKILLDFFGGNGYNI